MNGQAGDIMHKQGLSIGKVKEILALWRENCKEFPEKRPAQMVKLTADQAGVDFVDVVWIIIENSQKTEGVKN